MQRELAVLSSNFAFSFPVKMLELIKTLAVDEQHITPVTLGDRAEMAQRRYRALADEPGTRSVIGLSLRPSPEQLEAFRRANVPVVLIDESVPGASTVATDNVVGGMLAAKHLLAGGRRRIAVVCGNRVAGGGYNAAQRVKGLQQVLSAGGVTLDESMIVEVMNYSYNEGIEALNALLDAGKRPDAVFCAAGLRSRCAARGQPAWAAGACRPRRHRLRRHGHRGHRATAADHHPSAPERDGGGRLGPRHAPRRRAAARAPTQDLQARAGGPAVGVAADFHRIFKSLRHWAVPGTAEAMPGTIRLSAQPPQGPRGWCQSSRGPDSGCAVPTRSQTARPTAPRRRRRARLRRRRCL